MREQADIFTVIINTTMKCDANCPYCYHIESVRREKTVLRLEYLDKLFRILSEIHPIIQVSWNGGEPSNVPLSYYSKALKIQRKYYPQDGTVVNIFTTNGNITDLRYYNRLRRMGFTIAISPAYGCDCVLSYISPNSKILNGIVPTFTATSKNQNGI